MPSAPSATPPAFEATVNDIKSFMAGCTYEATRP